MKPRPPTCTLGRFVPSHMDTESVKREGFNQHGILVVAVDDQRLNFMERQAVRQIGDRLYSENKRGNL